jgi:hypothetical protein
MKAAIIAALAATAYAQADAWAQCQSNALESCRSVLDANWTK